MRFVSRSSLFLFLCMAACTNVHQATKRYRALSFDDLLLVAPADWTSSETIGAFIDHKRANGIEVTVHAVDLSLSADKRLESVRDALRRHDPGQDSVTAVLILGDLEMIPAGPWHLEGVEQPIYSDMPITITHENAPGLEDEVGWRDLEGHFETLPSHVVGRIPFEDPGLVDMALASSMRYEQGASDRKTDALFAASAWGPPLAVGIIVGGARDSLTEKGWHAVVHGVDGSPDEVLGGAEYLVLGNEDDDTRETFVATGLRVSMEAPLQEPLDQVPEHVNGLSFSTIQPEADHPHVHLRVTCFVPFDEELDTRPTMSLVGRNKADELRKLLRPTIRRLADALVQEMGELSSASLRIATAGITIVRSSATNDHGCTCGATWSHGRCDACGAGFTPMRERLRLDTLDDFCNRHFGGTIPAKSGLERNGITRAWAQDSPALVYTIGHGGRFSNGWESTLQFVISTISIAAESLEVRSREPSFEFKVGEEIDPITPTEPAVLFATGCAVAAPGDPLLRELFTDRWIVAYLGATTTVGPYPIIASTNAESHFARYLGGGLPLGLAGHATLAGYLNDARLDPTLYVPPGTIEGMRTNLASYILYGDPTLTLPRAGLEKQ